MDTSGKRTTLKDKGDEYFLPDVISLLWGLKF
jgi:hypothetical protein